MKIIVGLGNPGKEYIGTRHNVGFMLVDELVSREEIASSGEKLDFKVNKKFHAEIVETSYKGEKLIIAKPQTFMNLSGDSVRALVDFYKCEMSDLLVVSDDVDLPVGVARIRKEGSSGGHKGLDNIIQILGKDDFFRVRIGVSRPVLEENKIETKDYVLSPFSDRDLPVVKDMIEETISYLLGFIGRKVEILAHTLSVER